MNTYLRLASALAALALIAGASGCTAPCLRVQEILCECQGRTQDERQRCMQIAEAQERLAPPGPAQQEICAGLIEGCEAAVAAGCETLRTVEGKQACGLAER